MVGNLCGLDQSQLAGELAKLGMKAEDLSGTKKKVGGATKKGQSAAPPAKKKPAKDAPRRSSGTATSTLFWASSRAFLGST